MIYKTLDNGLRVIFDPIKSVETVALGMWVGVGSRSENIENNGIFHMLEHMAFKGTKTRSAKDIVEEIEDVGGYMNAYTSKHKTAYYFKLLKENVELGLDLLSDIVINSAYVEKELSREKGVILQEINQSKDTPDDIIFDYFFKTAYPEQSIGRPILGDVQNVKNISRDDLFKTVSEFYKPSNMILSVAGNIKADDLDNLIDKFFKNIPSGAAPKYEKAIYKGGEFKQIKDLEQVQFTLGFESMAYSELKEFYALNLLSVILGGGMSSRLFQEIREKRGLAYTVAASNASFSDTGLFYIYAGTGKDDLNSLMRVITGEINKIASEPVFENELNRAKTQLKASILMALESTSSRADKNASQLLFFNRNIAPEELSKKIDEINKDDILNVARNVFSSKPTVATLGPVEKQLGFSEFVELIKV